MNTDHVPSIARVIFQTFSANVAGEHFGVGVRSYMFLHSVKRRMNVKVAVIGYCIPCNFYLSCFSFNYLEVISCVKAFSTLFADMFTTGLSVIMSAAFMLAQ